MTLESVFYILAIVVLLANLVFLVVLTTLLIKIRSSFDALQDRISQTLTVASLPFVPKIAAMPFKLIGRMFGFVQK